jgi:hypothetical protein
MTPAPDIPIGERIRFYREAQHKKQAVVAGLAGITGDYLSQIERGLKTPRLRCSTASPGSSPFQPPRCSVSRYRNPRNQGRQQSLRSIAHCSLRAASTQQGRP